MRTLRAESLQEKDSTAYVFLEIFQHFMNSCSKKTFPHDLFCHLISQSQISFTEIKTLSIVAQNKLSNQYLHLNSQNQPAQIIEAIFQKLPPEVFCKKRCSQKVSACNFTKKETLAQVFSCEFCEISKNTFSDITPPGDCF